MSEIKTALTTKGPCVGCGEHTENEFLVLDADESVVPSALHRFHRCQECHNFQVEIDSAGMGFKKQPTGKCACNHAGAPLGAVCPQCHAEAHSKLEQIKRIANNALYFNDNSDYGTGLYAVCRALGMEQNEIGQEYMEVTPVPDGEKGPYEVRFDEMDDKTKEELLVNGFTVNDSPQFDSISAKACEEVKDAVCWKKCEMCGDFICNIHGGDKHVADCACPPIEDWPETIYPYEATVAEYLKAMETHPHCPKCDGPTSTEDELCTLCMEEE